MCTNHGDRIPWLKRHTLISVSQLFVPLSRYNTPAIASQSQTPRSSKCCGLNNIYPQAHIQTTTRLAPTIQISNRAVSCIFPSHLDLLEASLGQSLLHRSNRVVGCSGSVWKHGCIDALTGRRGVNERQQIMARTRGGSHGTVGTSHS